MCPVLCRWSGWMLFFCHIVLELPSTFFFFSLQSPNKREDVFPWTYRSGSCEYLAWHTLWCDGRSKNRPGLPFSPCIPGWAEGNWEGQIPLAVPSPCCSLAPCWGLWANAQMLQCTCPALPGSSRPSKLRFLSISQGKKSLWAGQDAATWHLGVCSLCSPCVSFLCLRMTEHCSLAVGVSLISTGSVDEVFHVALRPAALQGDMVWPVYSVLACIYPNLPKQVLFWSLHRYKCALLTRMLISHASPEKVPWD